MNAPLTKTTLDWRADFPIFANHPDLVFLDSAASAQKPKPVIDAMLHAMECHYANIHRGQYQLSALATENFENTRNKVKNFIGAKHGSEIIFSQNASTALNLLSYVFAEKVLNAGDVILGSPLEHHSNFVPWQQAAIRHGAEYKLCKLDEHQQICLESLENLLKTHRVKIIALAHISNVAGCITPVAKIAALAHQYGAYLVIDGAQAAPHLKLDMQILNADFYVITAHKLYGPTGIGVLYGREELLKDMPPLFYGGGTVDRVTLQSTSFLPPPARFEVGTPPIIEAAGLGAAIDYLEHIGLPAIEAYEMTLTRKLFDELTALDFISLAGGAQNRAGVFGFNLCDKKGNLANAHDVASMLDAQNIALRAGHHCAQPYLKYLGLESCVRASLGIYNSQDDIDALITALTKAAKILKLI